MLTGEWPTGDLHQADEHDDGPAERGLIVGEVECFESRVDAAEGSRPGNDVRFTEESRNAWIERAVVGDFRFVDRGGVPLSQNLQPVETQRRT